MRGGKAGQTARRVHSVATNERTVHRSHVVLDGVFWKGKKVGGGDVDADRRWIYHPNAVWSGVWSNISITTVQAHAPSPPPGHDC